MTKAKRILSNILILISLSHSAYGSSPIEVGILDIYPFGYHEKKGIHADWWSEVAKRTNISIKLYSYPLVRLRKELNQNRISLAIYGPPSKVEDQTNVINIIQHQELHFSILSLELLPSKTGIDGNLYIGMLRGASGLKELHNRLKFKPVFLSTYDSGAEMLFMYLI